MPEQSDFLNYYQILVFEYICVWHFGSCHNLLQWMVVQINSWTLETESLHRSPNIERHHHKDANAVVLFGWSGKHRSHGVIFFGGPFRRTCLRAQFGWRQRERRLLYWPRCLAWSILLRRFVSYDQNTKHLLSRNLAGTSFFVFGATAWGTVFGWKIIGLESSS